MPKLHPGELNAASVGIGSTSYLATELFKSVAGIDALLVPYNGAAPASTDVIAGRIGFWVTTLGIVLPNIVERANARTGDIGRPPRRCASGRSDIRRNRLSASSRLTLGLLCSLPTERPTDIVAQINADVNQALAIAGCPAAVQCAVDRSSRRNTRRSVRAAAGRDRNLGQAVQETGPITK